MNQSKKIWIGFDLGGTKMLSAAYDSEMKQLGREKKRTRASEGADAIVDRIIDSISKTIDKSDRGQGDLLGIGIGVQQYSQYCRLLAAKTTAMPPSPP